jgi:hypothetical protein
MNIQEYTIHELETRLKSHDWYCDFSDDHSVWSSGEASRKKILTLITQVNPEQARELWAKYAPKGFSCPI